MKGKRHTEEFKKEAVKQVTERGYSVRGIDKLTTRIEINRYFQLLLSPLPLPKSQRPVV